MTERERFEAWITAPPFEQTITRNSDDPETTAWPGQYRLYGVQLAWEAWQQAGAATGHGDAELRDLAKCPHCGYPREPQPPSGLVCDCDSSFNVDEDDRRLGAALRRCLELAADRVDNDRSRLKFTQVIVGNCRAKYRYGLCSWWRARANGVDFPLGFWGVNAPWLALERLAEAMEAAAPGTAAPDDE